MTSHSAAWEKVIPAKLCDRVSVYISHPVPWNADFAWSYVKFIQTWRESFSQSSMSLEVSPDLMANKLAIRVVKPGALR